VITISLWQDFSAQAMKSLIDGDSNNASDLWTKAIEIIEEEIIEPTFECGQVYYYLGKCQMDKDMNETALANLRKAEQIIDSIDPGHSMLKQLRYDLGQTLNRVGKSDEATTKLRFAKDIVDEPLAACLQGPQATDLNLRGIVKAFQKEKLLKNLSAKNLRTICQKTTAETGLEEDDVHFAAILDEYYTSEDEGELDSDSCLIWHHFNFNDHIAEALSSLNNLIGTEFFNEDDILSYTVPDEEKTNEMDNYRVFLRVNATSKSECTGVSLGNIIYCTMQDITQAYNWKLKEMNDSRRFVNISYFEGREIIFLMQMKSAAKLYKSGARNVFENLTKDLEPDLGIETTLTIT